MGGKSRGPAWIRGRRGVGGVGRGGPDLKGPQHRRCRQHHKEAGRGSALGSKQGPPRALPRLRLRAALGLASGRLRPGLSRVWVGFGAGGVPWHPNS